MAEPKNKRFEQTFSPRAVVKIRRNTSWLPYIAFLSPLWSAGAAVLFVALHNTLLASSFAAVAVMYAPVAILMYKNMKKNIDKIFSSYDRNGNLSPLDVT